MEKQKHTLATALMLARQDVSPDVFGSLVSHIDELTHLASVLSDPDNWLRLDAGGIGTAWSWKGPSQPMKLADQALDSLTKPA